MAHMTLDELTSQLSAVYGDGLRAVVLFGSAARGDRVTRNANLNVLVLVDAIRMEHLRREAAVAVAWRESGNPPPLTLTVEEWRGSADIFPMEYADILAHHRVLRGTLPLEGIAVGMRDLRLQLEHEAMSKLLRLRHAVLAAGGEDKAHRELLEGSISSFMTLLRALARLRGLDPATDSEALLTQLMTQVPVNLKPFERVLRFSRGVDKLDKNAVLDTVTEYLAAADSLARYADTFDGE